MYTFIILTMRLSAQRNSCPKRTYDLVQIWRDGGINKELKREQVGQLYSASLVWTVLNYGAKVWTLTKADEKRIESAELMIYTTRQLLGFVVRRKLSFFVHTISDDGSELAKCVIQGKVHGKRRRGRPKTGYRGNIAKWIHGWKDGINHVGFVG